MLILKLDLELPKGHYELSKDKDLSMGTCKLFFLIIILTMTLSSPLRSQEQQASPPGAVDHSLGQSFLAGMITAINIPIKGVLCVADAGLGFIVIGASGGRSYPQAAEIIEEGCAGPWLISSQMIREGQRKTNFSFTEGPFDSSQPEPDPIK